MEQGYLIDTNCIIDFANGKLSDNVKIFIASILDDQPAISVINKIEILGFSNPGNAILEFIKVIQVIGLTDDIVGVTVNVRRLHKIKLPDAIIAATALHHNRILVTRNVSDFKMIQSLTLINPWDR